ncbi:basic proline-rich protein-like [Eubalaena glacialis]|uniref:basic proline-rich protein-like n=1 Tax=Eubalaena glacialis TaxID=27606 RepID=UPI002A5AD45E|nr:basic proline-rich protein-like [Eubalaena glacialis]
MEPGSGVRLPRGLRPASPLPLHLRRRAPCRHLDTSQVRLQAARARAQHTQTPPGDSARAHARGQRAPGERGPHACAPPGPRPFPPPLLPPPSAARACPPPNPRLVPGTPQPPPPSARALPLARLAPPPPRPTRARVTPGNRSAAAPELCACVPPARPSLPLGPFPNPAQLREGGVAPSRGSEYRSASPAPPRRHRPAAAPAPRPPSRSARTGLAAPAPAPSVHRGERSGGSRRDALGGRCPLTSLGGRAGAGPEPGASPARRPAHGPPAPAAARPEDRAEWGSRLKDRDGRVRR